MWDESYARLKKGDNITFKSYDEILNSREFNIHAYYGISADRIVALQNTVQVIETVEFNPYDSEFVVFRLQNTEYVWPYYMFRVPRAITAKTMLEWL